MKVLINSAPFPAGEAFRIYRELQLQSEKFFFRAAMIALVCLSIKYLGLEIGDFQSKVIVTNPKIITGSLGWLTIFFFSASAWKHTESQPFARHCQNFIKSTKIDPETMGDFLNHALSLVYVLTLLVLMAAIAIAIYAAWSDMQYVLNSALGRISGTETFIGPFETCIQPKVTPK